MSPIRDDDRPKGVNWKPWVLGCVGLPLLLIAGCVALLGGAFFWARGSAPSRSALERARRNPAVVEALGTPLRASFSGNTEIESNVSTGEGKTTRAKMTIPVRGPKGSGILAVVAERRRGIWHYRQLEMTIDKTGQRIDLLSPAEAFGEATTPQESTDGGTIPR